MRISFLNLFHKRTPSVCCILSFCSRTYIYIYISLYTMLSLKNNESRLVLRANNAHLIISEVSIIHVRTAPNATEVSWITSLFWSHALFTFHIISRVCSHERSTILNFVSGSGSDMCSKQINGTRIVRICAWENDEGFILSFSTSRRNYLIAEMIWTESYQETYSNHFIC